MLIVVLIFFFINLFIHLISRLNFWKFKYKQLILRITKLLIVIILIFFSFWMLIKNNKIISWKNIWIFLWLIFAFYGDFFLIDWKNKKKTNKIFFLFGIISFLISHIFLSILVINIIKIEKIKFFKISTIITIITSIISLIVIFILLFKNIKNIFYLLLVLFYFLFFLFNINIIIVTNKIFLIAGILMFVISDILLGLKIFLKIKKINSFIVMLLYGLGMLFLTIGICNYFLI